MTAAVSVLTPMTILLELFPEVQDPFPMQIFLEPEVLLNPLEVPIKVFSYPVVFLVPLVFPRKLLE